MFKYIDDIKEYITNVDVEDNKISYDGKMKKSIFGHDVLLEKDPWLWHLHLKTTDACNAKCKFCVEQNQKCVEDAKQYLGSVDLMLREMESQGILYSVSVTGGEPLIFKEFSALCDVLRKHDIKFLTMNTNGKFLSTHMSDIDGLFDFVDISRHSVNDERNNGIFGCEMPSVSDLRGIKDSFKKTKMRIQCVIADLNGTEDMMRFIDTFRFADDISFRNLMRLSEQHGVHYKSKDGTYKEMLEYAFRNFDFVEQTIQDYYVYETWKNNEIPITFSYSNMRMLYNVEKEEDERVCREFIIHPDGVVSGSWDKHRKILYTPNNP